jgi:hypothetical protein
MITLNSKDAGSTFQVYADGKLIGYIRKIKGSSGDKYLALIDGKEESTGKEFDSPQDAVHWIEKCKEKEDSEIVAN